MGDIKDDPTNIVVTLPYEKYYQINDVTFMEEDLSETSTGTEFFIPA